jgi:hypothetical protein
MKKLLLLTLALPFMTSILIAEMMLSGHHYCHDIKTGDYRRIQPTDNPQPMAPHEKRPEYKRPYLACNPSDIHSKS